MSYDSDTLGALGKNIEDLNDNIKIIKDSNYLKTVELILDILDKGYCEDSDRTKYQILLQKYMTPDIAFNMLNENKQR